MDTHGEENLVPPERLSRGPRKSHARAAERDEGPVAEVDLHALYGRLRRDVEGEVRFDDGSRGLYAQDASNYLHVPLGVVVPRSADDVLATLAACRDAGAPVVSRAGGTALAGQTANEAVVIDFSKYLNRVLEFDREARKARVEPGLICDDLTKVTEPAGLTWGPQPATHSHCCFGGMLGNNCGGMRAQQAGIAQHHVDSMDVALYDGTRLSVGWMDDMDLERRAAAPDREGRLFAALAAFRRRHATLIANRMPVLPRRVSGYNLEELLPRTDGRFNLARALVGTESTCVTLLEATLGLVEFYRRRIVVALGYDSVYEAGDHVPDVLPFEPLAVEGMDRRLYDHVVQKHLRQQRFLGVLPEGNGWLLVELGSHEEGELRQRAERLVRAIRRSSTPPRSVKLLTDPLEQQHLWAVRESGLGATAFVPGQPLTWPGFEDSAVRPEDIGAYLRDLRRLFDEHRYSPSVYGHFGMGVVHCRIDFDLLSHAGVENYRRFMEEAADLVAVKYRGSLSGEHGDGQARGELLEKMFGAELVAAFREFKSIWDPAGRMNPGRVVNARPMTEDLRLGASYDPWQPHTHFTFPDDHGSFAQATLRCVGVGKCRRVEASGEQDTMCPSFMVTREEKHSTRGRAHLLWEMLRREGTPIERQFRSENVKEALDLCLSCKGCKGDCPVNVDMATYKAEFLSHYYAHRLRPRHAYAFGLINRWARLGSAVPRLANAVTHAPGLSRVAKFLAGMAQERTVPRFSKESFRRWFAKRGRSPGTGERVLLFPDTFNDHFHADTAKAATLVLEQLGFEVVIPGKALCCGRPLYDYGMLDRAERYLERTLAVLKPHVDAGTPMVVLEPSCCAVFRDELPALMPNRIEAANLSKQTFLLSEFLLEHAKERIPKLRKKAIVQGHCHQKAVMHFDSERRLLQAMGVDATVLESGCCGMAGSFGFEADKYAVSQAVGERVLLPRVREAGGDTLVVADGFSCRTQIEQGTSRQPLHVAELLHLALSARPGVTDEVPSFPEIRRAEPPPAHAWHRRAVWLSFVLVVVVALLSTAFRAVAR